MYQTQMGQWMVNAVHYLLVEYGIRATLGPDRQYSCIVIEGNYSIPVFGYQGDHCQLVLVVGSDRHCESEWTFRAALARIATS